MKRSLCKLIAAVFSCIIAAGCSQQPGKTGEDVTVVPDSFNISFRPYPPVDLDSNSSPKDLVEFAWEEFLALNWRSSFSGDGLRDNPDTLWSYSDTAAYPDLAVWETYAHRTELRPYSDKMLPFDNAPHYSFGAQPLQLPGSNASFTLFHNLDENNEIGSCDVYAHADKFGKAYKVLYQAKVNRDEYEYVYQNFNTKAKLVAATGGNVSNISKYKAYYPGANGTCECPPEVFCLPCGGQPKPGGGIYTGAMEVKTAWRELTPADDPSRFFSRKVIYYVGNSATGKVYYNNKTYALIGLHIIHKTQNFQDFVFATWEQVDVQKSGMAYSLLGGDGADTGQLQVNYPRLHPIAAITEASTAFVHAKLKATNPRSIWQYYRLVGVQGRPSSDTSSFNYFLANYVVESDSTLANFNGSGIGKPFDRGANTLYRGQLLTVGGCQGCHGVSQMRLGGDFSFLMDTIGKPVLTPDIGQDSTLKFKRFLRALSQKQR